jgi:hypothetical protein
MPLRFAKCRCLLLQVRALVVFAGATLRVLDIAGTRVGQGGVVAAAQGMPNVVTLDLSGYVHPRIER